MKLTPSISGDHTAAKPRVMECVCAHDYQDQRYGKGMRLHNPRNAPSGTKKFACTVCGKEKVTS